MDVGTEDQELGMVRVYFQSFLYLQLAFLNLVVNQVVLGLFVQSLKLWTNHLNEKGDLSITLIYCVCVPKLFVSL